jgi:hypothetical protein
MESALRIEMGGDLHQYGGLDWKLLDTDEAKAAVTAGAHQSGMTRTWRWLPLIGVPQHTWNNAPHHCKARS